MSERRKEQKQVLLEKSMPSQKENHQQFSLSLL